MNYYNHFKGEQQEDQLLEYTPRVIPYHQQLAMLIDTLQFVLNKVSELCKWKQEQTGLKRKKSMIKLFDKNIDKLPQLKMQAIDVPIFDEIPKILNRLQTYKSSLPQNQDHDQDTSSQVVNYIKAYQQQTSQRFDLLESQLQQMDTRLQAVQTDMLELINLYKDLL